MTHPLISADWLAGLLDQPEIAVLDATWFMPGGRDGRAEFAAGHVPGARFFDIDAVADHSSGLPHMLPSPEAFAQAMTELGVGDDARVIVYDANDLMASARLWWTLRVMGHDDVHVLDGGLTAWRAEGRPIETGTARPVTPPRFTARFRPELVRDFAQVLAATGQVVDARPGPRFRGEAAEPRAGLRSGHMPNARSLPHTQLLTVEGRLKDPPALAAAFATAGVDVRAPLIASCGSGVTAAVLALGLARIGIWDAPVYDGSWTEWGARPDAPVQTS